VLVVQFYPLQQTKINVMEDKEKEITCIVGLTIRNLLDKAKSLEIKKEDIVNIFPMEGQIYMIFYK
jgi:hypothetical protein